MSTVGAREEFMTIAQLIFPQILPKCIWTCTAGSCCMERLLLLLLFVAWRWFGSRLWLCSALFDFKDVWTLISSAETNEEKHQWVVDISLLCSVNQQCHSCSERHFNFRKIKKNRQIRSVDQYTPPGAHNRLLDNCWEGCSCCPESTIQVLGRLLPLWRHRFSPGYWLIELYEALEPQRETSDRWSEANEPG